MFCIVFGDPFHRKILFVLYLSISLNYKTIPIYMQLCAHYISVYLSTRGRLINSHIQGTKNQYLPCIYHINKPVFCLSIYLLSINLHKSQSDIYLYAIMYIHIHLSIYLRGETHYMATYKEPKIIIYHILYK